MSKSWLTSNGDRILYKDLTDQHLRQILRYILQKAEEGIVLREGGGYDLDDLWYDETTLEGEDVLEHFDYNGLKREQRRRERVVFCVHRK